MAEENAQKSTEEIIVKLNKMLERMPYILEEIRIICAEKSKAVAEKQSVLSEYSGKPVENIKPVPVPEGNKNATQDKETIELTELINKNKPDNVNSDNVRSVLFFYSADNKKLCKNVLSEIDALCASSQTNPMFISRKAVKQISNEKDLSFDLRKYFSRDISGFVYTGTLSDEKKEEISLLCKSFNTGFINIDNDTSVRSTVLDFLFDVIINEKASI